LALNAAEWLRRVILVILSPDPQHYRARCQAEILLSALFSFVRPPLTTNCCGSTVSSFSSR
jgi:hypothetical protein